MASKLIICYPARTHNVYNNHPGRGRLRKTVRPPASAVETLILFRFYRRGINCRRRTVGDRFATERAEQKRPFREIGTDKLYRSVLMVFLDFSEPHLVQKADPQYSVLSLCC